MTDTYQPRCYVLANEVDITDEIRAMCVSITTLVGGKVMLKVRRALVGLDVNPDTGALLRILPDEIAAIAEGEPMGSAVAGALLRSVAPPATSFVDGEAEPKFEEEMLPMKGEMVSGVPIMKGVVAADFLEMQSCIMADVGYEMVPEKFEKREALRGGAKEALIAKYMVISEAPVKEVLDVTKLP